MRTILGKAEKIIITLLAQRVSFKKNPVESNAPLVSIIIVAHNALDELKNCIASLQQTAYPNFEIVVVNNKSEPNVKRYLDAAKRKGTIQHVMHSKKNLFFSGGNNLGVRHASKKTDLLVLLNSDTVILHPDWLSALVRSRAPNGIISFGSAPLPFRPDGWCFLIPKKLYERYGGIDTAFKMNWGITDMTERAARAGVPISVILNYNTYIRHLGERSYTLSGKHLNQNISKPSFLKLLLSPLWFRVQAILLQTE
ncbi:glycosyltransferase [Candidatus Woesebacteria bacterium]|nr:glycosyltransferase [Candidatus Woesebacteria bacterium]